MEVLSVFGAFNSHALVLMTADEAREFAPDGLATAGPTVAAEAVRQDIERLRELAPDLADSGMAATMMVMALEMENPFNSATSKANCADTLLKIADRLRELAPAGEEKGGIVHDIRSGRARSRRLRVARGTGTED